MRAAFRLTAIFLAPVMWVLEYGTWCYADDSEIARQLGLADLAGYRAALSGKATADDAKTDDPPARVAFRDLWNRPDQFRGRRVTVQGRVARIFRQGPVGSFPPLAEVWVTSPAGDPYCVVFPQPAPRGEANQPSGTPRGAESSQGRALGATLMPNLGGTVRFTGTFLKQVSYAAGDGARLAPLVVGDRPPVPVPSSETADGARSRADDLDAPLRSTGTGNNAGDRPDRSSQSLLPWVLSLALAAAAASIVLRRHLRSKLRRTGSPHAGRNAVATAPVVPDTPLEFIEPPEAR
jgi:hypothetical protein